MSRTIKKQKQDEREEQPQTPKVGEIRWYLKGQSPVRIRGASRSYPIEMEGFLTTLGNSNTVRRIN